MKLRVRHILISINTDKGRFGAELSLGDGLNIIRAENYSGKSTLLQAIIYALGLEGMFGPSHDVPLPHVVTDFLEYPEGQAKVLDSEVFLEIENASHQFLTVQRSISGLRNRHLITVFEGRAITRKEALDTRRDYFVREGGAATNERGFHHRLQEFIGWELPFAPRFNDEPCPLYMETIFPLLYVEQKLGWGRIPARYPTWLGIRDVARRTVEFILGLDAYRIGVERVAVQTEINRIRGEWTALRTQTGRLATAVAGVVNGIPNDPVSVWPPEIAPQFLLRQAATWAQLPTYLPLLRSRLAELTAEQDPKVKAVDSQLRNELDDAERALAEREAVISLIVDKIEVNRTEADTLANRIESIKDDLRKYKDVRKLRRLGSTDQPESAKGVCPTCHQELADTLLDLGRRAEPMSVDQNVSFYEEQVELFTAVLENLRGAVRESEIELQTNREEIEKSRERIRAIKETLVSPAGTPSVEAVTERVRLEQRIGNLETILSNFEDTLAEFAELAAQWNAVQERRARLPKGALSEADENKVNSMEASFRQQLVLYKMGSIDPSKLNISRGNYEPEVAGLNLPADVSGSDLIRLQWAYLLALLELGLSDKTNHPGLLVMDEPQQQSVEESAFLRMIEYAANFSGAQVLIATSHERASMGEFISRIGVKQIFEYDDARIMASL